MTQTPVVPAPTQTRHPWRATVRTVIAVVVSLASLLPYVAAQADVDAVPAVAQVLVVAAAITRIMAIPGVNEWLTSIGLGATPRT
jgi:hypothetical protein